MRPLILKSLLFRNSARYWERRYRRGGTSGKGSYDDFAAFKAKVINDFVVKEQIRTVIEFGCGDGNQLQQMRYLDYTGYDVSNTAVEKCRRDYESMSNRQFFLVEEYDGKQADLSLSLDVIYHLVEEKTFNLYLQRLFSSSARFIIIFSSNTHANPSPRQPHVLHRKFTDYIEHNEREWSLTEKIDNPVVGERKLDDWHADFYIYRKMP